LRLSNADRQRDIDRFNIASTKS